MNIVKRYLLTAICCVFTLLAQSAQAQVTYIHTDILGSQFYEDSHYFLKFCRPSTSL